MKLDDFLSSQDKQNNTAIEIDIRNISKTDFDSIMRGVNEYKYYISNICVNLNSNYASNIKILESIFSIISLKSLHIIAPEKTDKWQDDRYQATRYGNLFENLTNNFITELTLENFKDLSIHGKVNFLTSSTRIKKLTLISPEFQPSSLLDLLSTNKNFSNIQEIKIKNGTNFSTLDNKQLEALRKVVLNNKELFHIEINDDNLQKTKEKKYLYNEIVRKLNARNPKLQAKYINDISYNIIETEETIAKLEDIKDKTKSIKLLLNESKLKIEKLTVEFNNIKQQIDGSKNIHAYIYLGDALQIIGSLKDAVDIYNKVPKEHEDYITASYKKFMLLNTLYNDNSTIPEQNNNISDLLLDYVYNLGIALIFNYNNNKEFYNFSLEQCKEVARCCEEHLHKLYFNKNSGLNEIHKFSNIIYDSISNTFISNIAELNYCIRKILCNKELEVKTILNNYNQQGEFIKQLDNRLLNIKTTGSKLEIIPSEVSINEGKKSITTNKL